MIPANNQIAPQFSPRRMDAGPISTFHWRCSGSCPPACREALESSPTFWAATPSDEADPPGGRDHSDGDDGADGVQLGPSDSADGLLPARKGAPRVLREGF